MILYGSRARGDFRADSDYDLAGFVDEETTYRDSRLLNGKYLDIWIYPSTRLLNPDDSMLQMLGGRVLVERESLGRQCLDKLNALYLRGPTPLPPDQRQTKILWGWKMLERISAGDTEAHFRRHWLMTALLEDYFLLRGQWYRGPKESLEWIRTQRPDDFAIFQQALAPAATLDAIKSAVAMVSGFTQPAGSVEK
ncbi:MAG: hypothetical protein RIQ81_1172 [Pseudomonadota bacterium]